MNFQLLRRFPAQFSTEFSYDSTRQAAKLVFALFSEPLHFAPLAVQFCLIGVDLTLLVRLSVLLTLQLIADQRSAAQSKRAANRRASARMAHRGANQTACRSTAKRADSRAFFTSG